MNDILAFIILALAGLVIAVKIAVTVSVKFRRWLYSKN